jgi:hypothetical protein
MAIQEWQSNMNPLMDFISATAVWSAQIAMDIHYPGAPAFVVAWCAAMVARKMLLVAWNYVTGRWNLG